jgi:hypothetical protein
MSKGSAKEFDFQKKNFRNTNEKTKKKGNANGVFNVERKCRGI